MMKDSLENPKEQKASKGKKGKWAVGTGVVLVALVKILKGSTFLVKLLALRFLIHHSRWEWLWLGIGVIIAIGILYKVAVFFYRKKISTRNVGRSA